MVVDMKEKSAIVTGASSGIGYATAFRLVGDGATVIGVGRSETALNRLRDECVELEGELKIHLADLREISQIEQLVSFATDTLGSLDILVNSAGIIGNGSIEDTTSEDWDRMMGINVKSVFQLTQLCIPLLAKNKGSVVNVSSVAGKRSFPNVLAYCVSKAAVDQMTKCAALELAEKGIRVNAVNPGVVVSNLHKRSGMDDEQYAAFLEHSKTTHPLGRVGKPEEVADLIEFLASDSSSWITGGTFEIDGGRAQTCAR
jgi:NAD(P)-dependent dehydrogenase (short-subunit alcohol dehydrogenase family)